MSLNTLEVAYANGQIIDASHINELTLALLGQLVGRDANGVPTPGQSLGTLAIQWGTIYGTSLILGGLAIDTSQIVSLPNRIVSGKTRALSSLGDFLRPDGAALEFDILGASVDLVLSINAAAVAIASDLTKTGFVAAPAANNTCLVNDTSIINDLHAGEVGYFYDSPPKENQIIIDNVDSEISNRVGQFAAFETPTGEILLAFIKSATLLTDIKRGWFFNSSGNAIDRGSLSNNDALTILSTGWIFIEDNGTTIDITYRTPIESFTSPSSPLTGDYWLDFSNQVWKRYSGTAFEIIDRILLGVICADTTKCKGARNKDFSNQYKRFNNIELVVDTTEIVKSKLPENRVSVYGTEIFQDNNELSWNITTDLESPQTESASSTLWIYLSDNSEQIFSETRPQVRNDLKGHYHPHHSWLCVGVLFNDSSSNITLVSEIGFNTKISSKSFTVKHIVANTVAGGTFTTGAWRTSVFNTETSSGVFHGSFLSNQVTVLPGLYKVTGWLIGKGVNAFMTRLRNITDTSTEKEGSYGYSSTNDNEQSRIENEIVISTTKIFELQGYCQTTVAGDGFGFGGNPLDGATLNTFAMLDFEKVG